jgi:dTDP-4-amino-4,6-dideoxygalactose transaminase
MEIPFVDFSQQYLTIKDEIDSGLKSVFEKGNFILGQEEKDFASDFAKYCDVTYAVGVNSGTDALYLALSALGIKQGDEVIIPSFTFIASALCVSYTGATPVFADIEDKTYNIDPNKLKEYITDKTKAILLVHIYGQPANMEAINAIAKGHNIAVLEDACQAHGATYKGKKTGSLSKMGCFSFYPTKSLGAFGDGGMIVMDSKEEYDKVRMLGNYGRKGRYEHKIKGYNSRLDTVQAVVLSAKLKYLDEWNKMRNDHANYYCELLRDVKEIKLPEKEEDRTHVYQTFAIRIKERDKVSDEMKKKGVGVLIHYPIPLHLQEAYAELGYKRGDLPVSEGLADEELSLPMFPHMNNEQIEYVCESLKTSVMNGG